jgi:multicomponent Na+:H+ antiporter subunit B
MKKWFAVISVGVMGLVLIYAVLLLPPMGANGVPTTLNVIPHYLKYGVTEGGAENIVTAIILNYRGYDTMGEVTVIFSALISVLAVLNREKRELIPPPRYTPGYEPSIMVRTAIKLVLPFILLFSVYTILMGKYSPGGGFQGGAVIAAGFIVYTIIFGLYDASRYIPLVSRITIEGIAPFAFFSGGLVGIFTGLNFLTYKLPGLSVNYQSAISATVYTWIEIGIGVGGATIFTSILFALLKEE